MRRLRPLLWFVALAVTCGAGAQIGNPQSVALDAARSRAAFEVKLFFLFGLHGEFGSVHGTLTFDKARHVATVDATIDTNAVHMRNRRYENWIKSAEFFDAEHFPQIHFASGSFPLQRLDEGGSIAGVLTIRGITNPVTFEVAPPDCRTVLAGTCAVRASGAIKRSDFGMHSRRGALSDNVDLSLSILVQPATAP